MANRRGNLAAVGVSGEGAPNGSPEPEIRPEKAVFEKPTWEGLWTAYETAEFLAISPQALWHLVEKGMGPPAFGVTEKRGIRFIPSEVRAWLETRRLPHNGGDHK